MSQIHKHGFTNTTAFALPLVTGVWFDADSFVESPISYVKEDGTRVTSFEDSIAKWAGVKTSDLLEEGYDAWDAVYAKTREAEADTSRTSYPKMCHNEGTTRFGVSKDILRISEITKEDIYFAELEQDARDEL